MSQQLKLTRGEDYQWISEFLTKPYFMTSQDFEYSTQTFYDNVMVFWVRYKASKLLFLFIVIALIKKRPAQSSVPQWQWPYSNRSMIRLAPLFLIEPTK